MGKKSKNPHTSDKQNEADTLPSDSKTLTVEEPPENSLFSASNPFRRKPEEKIQLDSGLGVSKKDGNLGESKLHKRKDGEKTQSSNLYVEDILKLKSAVDLKNGEKNGNVGEGSLSKEVDTLGSTADGRNKKKNKRKRDELEAEYEARKHGVSVTEEKKEVAVVGEKRKTMDNVEDMTVEKEEFDDESKLLRTVFVGNLPLKLKKKELAKEFGKFGEVESVRIRSIPIIDSKMPRKGAVIKKKINENGDSVHAYIVFKTEESAQASLAHNMAVVSGNHIRVDRACPPRKKLKGDDSPLYDTKRTVFVGNLPFDVKDEEIYKLFCGIKNLETSVEAVRVIRDSGSSLGKGIAYVLFKTTEAVNQVLKKRNLALRDRELRLSRAKPDATTPSKRKNPSTPRDSKNDHSSAKRMSFGPRTPDSSSKKSKSPSNMSYQGLRASKSGQQKKFNTRNPSSSSNSKPETVEESKTRAFKRPAVAARKERALRAANKAATTPVAGKKRKMNHRTPGKSGEKKKARKFR